MPYSHSRGWDEYSPTEEQARAVAVYLRGADDFPHARVDWLAVARLGGRLVGDSDPVYAGIETAPPPARAKAALQARRAIVSGERPSLRDVQVSFETLGAVYFMLTAGQYTRECPNHRSPQGRHRWRFGELTVTGSRTANCDYCGDERTLR